MTDEELRGHPIAAALTQINAAKDWDEVKEAQGNPEYATQLNRIFGFADLLGQRVAATPASLISDSGLRALANTLAAVSAELVAFRSDGGAVSHFAAAVQLIDQTGLNQLWALPISPTPSGSVEVGRLADDFQNRVKGIIEWLEGERARLAAANTTLSEQLTLQGTQITTLGELLTQQKTEAQATTAEVKRDYAKAEQELRDKFQLALEAQVTQGTELVATQKLAFANAQKADEGAATKLIEELQSKRDEAATIVGIVGNIGVTGNYQKIADTEGSTANTWRWITLGVFAAAGLFGALTIWEVTKGHVEWNSAILRLVFMFFIVGIALYTARESARHRTTADRSRRTELELASLGPFLANLTKEKQDEIREKLTYLYFGNTVDAHVVESSIKDAADALTKVGATVAEAVKKIPH